MTSSIDFPSNFPKCYFSKYDNPLKIFYIRIPLKCKFDRKCNGNCRKLSFRVIHSDKKYCFKINCNDEKCIKNHLLDWNDNLKEINHITPYMFAKEIYYRLGKSNIISILNDNVNNVTDINDDPLFFLLEQINEEYEGLKLSNKDDRNNELEEKRRFIEKSEKERIKFLESMILRKRRITAHFNVFNQYNDYLNEIKLVFEKKKKENIFGNILMYLDDSKTIKCKKDKKLLYLINLYLKKRFDNSILCNIRKFLDINELFF